jgi:hypothetical protein
MRKELFSFQSQSVNDYRYLQSLGPWGLPAGDTLHLAFAIGIGDGTFGLYRNLQSAYDLYWQTFKQKHLPYLRTHSPENHIVPIYTGEEVIFQVSAADNDGDSLIYVWTIDDQVITGIDSSYFFQSAEFLQGTHYINVEISDGKARAIHEWVVLQQPPRAYRLEQNFPNPFNSGTTIPFELKEPSDVAITVYNIRGEQVVTLVSEPLPAGR